MVLAIAFVASCTGGSGSVHAHGADNAFLALPGSDGLVHDGKQLFGDFARQPPSTTPNGFAALAGGSAFRNRVSPR
jgi:hypothetical protein